MERVRNSVILAADLPDFARIESRDKNRADDLASAFHQVFGECVYALDGTVSDTLGSVVIAEMPDATRAVDAASNLKRRIRTEYASETAMAPRAVITTGEVYERDFSLVGRAVQNALAILDSLKRDQFLVAGEVVSGSGHVIEGEPILKLGDTEYYVLPSSRPAPAGRPAEPGSAAEAAASDASDDTLAAPGRKRWIAMAAGAAALLLIVAVWFWMNPEPTPAVTEAPPAEVPVSPADSTVDLSIGAVTIAEGVGSEEESTTAVALITALLQSARDVELRDLAENRLGVDVRLITPEPAGSSDPDPVAPGAAAQIDPVASALPPEPRVVPWVESSGERLEGPSAEYRDVWSIVVTAVNWAGEELGFSTENLAPQSERLRSTFRTAVLAGPLASDRELLDLHSALSAEPQFLPGWLVLARANTHDPRLLAVTMDAARNISRLMPERTDLARDLGRRELAEGTLAGAVEAYARLHAAEPGDSEALRVFALASLASHQPERFRKFASGSFDPRIHAADLEVSEGKINEAVKRYYETEAEVPDNPYLSFKIGRIAVLRRSPQIAQIEIDKLETLGTEPQRSLLKAYMAADQGDRAAAVTALSSMLEIAEWSDSPSFHAAEVHAILRDAGNTLSAIERSVERREPMMHAIATNPLFGYLTNEPRFREAVRKLQELQQSIAASLEKHP